MWDSLLQANISDPVFLWCWFVVSALLIAVLLWKIPSGVRRKQAYGFLVGAFFGLVLLWVTIDLWGLFGEGVNFATWIGGVAVFALSGLVIATIPRRGAWRKVVSILSIPVFFVSAGLAVNAAYGVTPTLASLLGIQVGQPLAIPSPEAAIDSAEPIYQNWHAPSDLPAHGETGVVPQGIPNTHSKFPARQASLYLPPAALVSHPPKLPFVIMMMGYPGNPDPAPIASALDRYASGHQGLAPIALMVDQLGVSGQDPMCLDTKIGNVETYVMKDVVPWAKTNLPIREDRSSWTFAGYSNGGECATYFGVKYPETFGSLVAISPDTYPGEENNDRVLNDFFHHDQQAYDSVKPAHIMSEKAPYSDSVAIFSAGENDTAFAPGTRELSQKAQAAGIKSTFISIPGGDHGASGRDPALNRSFAMLGARWGLEP